jgi:DNA-binding MarR family transcriptional regulator
MQSIQTRLRLNKPLSLHVTGILSLVITAQDIMARVGAACERHGITRPQYNVLRILRGAGTQGHPRKEIASRMVENAPDITRLLDRLEAQGHVRRSRSAEDHRESIARITTKGLKLLRIVDQDVSQEEGHIGYQLLPHEWKNLITYCEKLFSSENLPKGERRARGR